MNSIKNIGKYEYSNLPAGKKGKNYVLAIGIDKYRYCTPLCNAVKDINDFVSLLKDKFGFDENSEIQILADTNATHKGIINAFKDLVEIVTSNDSIIIYFSGHGELDKTFDMGYWIPFEAQVGEITTYISTDIISKIVTQINSLHTLLIVDSCYSGSLFLDGKNRFISCAYDFPSRWGLTSGRNTVVSDGKAGTNSPFSAALLDVLTRISEPINISALSDIIKQSVPAATNNLQKPICEPLRGGGHKGGQFVFRPKNMNIESIYNTEYSQDIMELRKKQTEDIEIKKRKNEQKNQENKAKKEAKKQEEETRQREQDQISG